MVEKSGSSSSSTSKKSVIEGRPGWKKRKRGMSHGRGKQKVLGARRPGDVSRTLGQGFTGRAGSSLDLDGLRGTNARET